MYQVGEKVRCNNITEENVEQLEVGKYYTIQGSEILGEDLIYIVRGEDGQLHYSMDRFTRMVDEMKGEVISVETFKGILVERFKVPEIPKLAQGGIITQQPFPVQQFDIVEKPAHYNQYRVEVIDIIEDAIKGVEGLEAVSLANVLKYVLRYRFKNGTEDLEKAMFYLRKLIDVRKHNDTLRLRTMTKKQQGYIARLTSQLGIERTEMPSYLCPVKDYHDLTEIEASQVIDKLLTILEFTGGRK